MVMEISEVKIIADKIKENDFDVLYKRSQAYFYNMDFKNASADIIKAQQIDGLNEERKGLISILSQKIPENQK